MVVRGATGHRVVQGLFPVAENKRLSEGNYRLIFTAGFIARNSKPGQFLQIGADGLLLKRPFSVCDVQGNRVVVLYKVVGEGTRRMALQAKGDNVEVIGPLGQPFAAVPSGVRAIFVGGGVGVPPLYFLAKASRPKGAIAFLGAREKPDLLYPKEFQKLRVIVRVSTENGSAGHRGFVTQPFRAHVQTLGEEEKTRTVVYTCGPTPMMQAVAEICEEEGLQCLASLEEVMACGVGVCMGCVVRVHASHPCPSDGKGKDEDWSYRRVCREGPVFDTQDIVWSGHG